jgi:hypothetical protein
MSDFTVLAPTTLMDWSSPVNSTSPLHPRSTRRSSVRLATCSLTAPISGSSTRLAFAASTGATTPRRHDTPRSRSLDSAISEAGGEDARRAVRAQQSRSEVGRDGADGGCRSLDLTDRGAPELRTLLRGATAHSRPPQGATSWRLLEDGRPWSMSNRSRPSHRSFANGANSCAPPRRWSSPRSTATTSTTPT